jgi:hypothetical protein
VKLGFQVLVEHYRILEVSAVTAVYMSRLLALCNSSLE